MTLSVPPRSDVAAKRSVTMSGGRQPVASTVQRRSRVAIRAAVALTGQQLERLDQRLPQLADFPSDPSLLDLSQMSAGMSIVEDVRHPPGEIAVRRVVREHGGVD